MPRHLPSAVRLLVLAAALATSTACRRASGPPPERFLDAKSEVAVVVPDLRRAAKDLAALQDTAATFPGTGSVREFRRVLSGQLGFDPLDPDALAEAGIEPSRGLAVGLEPPAPTAKLAIPTPVLLLPVRDAAALERTVARVARERLGASRRAETTEGALRVWTYEGDDVLPLVLALREGDRTAALSSGLTAASAVRAALGRAQAGSLAEAAGWRQLRKALGDRYSVFVGTSAGGPSFGLPHEIVLGVTAEPGALRAGVALRPPGDATALRAAKGGDAKAALRALSPEAPLALRWDGDPAALGRLLLANVPEHDRRWLAEHGFDLQKDLFDVLAPGVAASVSLSPRLDLREFDELAARADPLRVVRFELVADVKDEARAAQALSRLPALFAALQGPGAKPAPAADASGRTGRIPTPSGEVAWRLDGKRLFVAGGAPGALEALAARKSPGWTAPTKASAAALEGGLGSAVLAPRVLAAGVRGLPDEAYGTDPAGFLMRSVVESFLAPLDRLQAVAARAEVAEGALVVALEAEAAPVAKTKAEATR